MSLPFGFSPFDDTDSPYASTNAAILQARRTSQHGGTPGAVTPSNQSVRTGREGSLGGNTNDAPFPRRSSPPPAIPAAEDFGSRRLSRRHRFPSNDTAGLRTIAQPQPMGAPLAHLSAASATPSPPEVTPSAIAAAQNAAANSNNQQQQQKQQVAQKQQVPQRQTSPPPQQVQLPQRQTSPPPKQQQQQQKPPHTPVASSSAKPQGPKAVAAAATAATAAPARSTSPPARSTSPPARSMSPPASATQNQRRPPPPPPVRVSSPTPPASKRSSNNSTATVPSPKSTTQPLGLAIPKPQQAQRQNNNVRPTATPAPAQRQNSGARTSTTPAPVAPAIPEPSSPPPPSHVALATPAPAVPHDQAGKADARQDNKPNAAKTAAVGAAGAAGAAAAAAALAKQRSENKTPAIPEEQDVTTAPTSPAASSEDADDADADARSDRSDFSPVASIDFARRNSNSGAAAPAAAAATTTAAAANVARSSPSARDAQPDHTAYDIGDSTAASPNTEGVVSPFDEKVAAAGTTAAAAGATYPAVGANRAAATAKYNNEGSRSRWSDADGLNRGAGAGAGGAGLGATLARSYRSHKKWWLLAGAALLIIIIGASIGGAVGSKSSSSGSNKATSPGPSGTGTGSGGSSIEPDSRLHNSFYGLNYVPFESDPTSGCGCNLTGVIDDVKLISQLTTRVRLSGSACNETALVLDAIQRTGVNLTVWPAVTMSDDTTTTSSDWVGQLNNISFALESYGTKHIGGVQVGYEFVSNTGTVQQLLRYISAFRTAVAGANIPVGTAEATSVWTQAMADGVDFIFANNQPWYSGIDVADAAGWTWDYFNDTITPLAQDAPANEALDSYISEVGWPSGAASSAQTTLEAAVASTANLQTFLDTYVCAANKNGTGYFFFEMYDDPDQATSSGVGGYWGLFDEQKQLKSITIPDCDHS